MPNGRPKWSHIGLQRWLKRHIAKNGSMRAHVELAFCGASSEDCPDCVLRPIHGNVMKAFKVCTRTEGCSAKTYNDVVVDGSHLWC